MRAGELLNNDKKAGTFLIRFSSLPGQYTLSEITKSGETSHYRIQYIEGKFKFADSNYPSLDALIKEGKDNKKHPLYPLKKACQYPTPFKPMLERKKYEKKKGTTEEASRGLYVFEEPN